MTDMSKEQSKFRADRPDDLLRTQKRAVGLILKQFADVALKELQRIPDKRQNERDVIRPDYVYCIDGARGSGKTYTLLSLADAIERTSNFAGPHPPLTDLTDGHIFSFRGERST